jgi:NADPH:quinone reductase-like Zn-dependent oxidoreductase
MVIYSAAGGRETPFNLFDFYRRRQQFFGLDTAQFDLAEIARLYEKFSPLFASGAIKAPPIAAIFPLARAPEAYELVKSGISGKVAIVPTGAPEGGAASAAAAASPSKSDAASVPALA